MPPLRLGRQRPAPQAASFGAPGKVGLVAPKNGDFMGLVGLYTFFSSPRVGISWVLIRKNDVQDVLTTKMKGFGMFYESNMRN